MVFQDFGHLTERRKVERQQKLKKRIVIGAITGLVLILVIASGAFAVVQYNGKSSKNVGAPKETVSQSVKAVEMICASADYKETCVNSLTKVVNSSTLVQPKDLVKAAIQVTSDEIKKSFNSTFKLNFETPKEKEAFEVCKQLIENAVEELGESMNNVAVSKTADLSNWLSAVMSYQATCIDGFPEGKLKTQIEKSLHTAKELTSNSLAIISEVKSILSTFQIPTSRRLLTDEDTVDKDGLPSWMSHEDRRVLRAHAAAKLKPNVIVAKDGSGQFKTISAALSALPKKYPGRYVIYVKQGIYDESVIMTKKMVNITMYGDGSQKTIVTGRKNFVDGINTYNTATFAAMGDGFIAKAMGFRNTAGAEKHQAVALRVQADRAVFLNCRMEGYQDTLYAQTHRQFYRSCYISGTIDFIFGDAAALFQNCLIVVRKPLDNQQCIVTAQGRTDRRETTGIVLQNCRIVADKLLTGRTKSYLGRPWKEFSRTIIMESTIGGLIHPDGWLPWLGDFALKTLYYAEYNNKGPGAGLKARIKWPGYKRAISKVEAVKYTAGPFLQSDWIKASAVPIHWGLMA